MKWTLEILNNEVKKYKTSKEFRKGSWNAYVAAQRMGLLGQICENLINVNEKWSLELIREQANKYTNRSDFKKNNYSAYQAALRRPDYELITSHMDPSMTEAYTLEELKEEANKYTTRGDFAKYSIKAYDVAYRRKDYEEIVSHMPISSKEAYTLEELKEEALLYRTRSIFSKNSPGPYQAAIKRSDFDEICSHMDVLKRNWNEEDIQKEANRYEFRVEFQNGSPAYQAACKKGIGFLDKICSHMKPSSGSSIPERIIFNTVITIHRDTKKLVDRNVKITHKTYIKGFDIDIFVPSLMRGIEFDGTRYHSFEFMRADPKKFRWSNHDIQNYHKIKDDWFASKGIQILHIKEADWKDNKDLCIRRCLDFLGVN